MLTRVAVDFDQPRTQGVIEHMVAIAAEVRSSRRAGRKADDHILATKRYDRVWPIHGPTVILYQDPTSGIRDPSI
jgi:hypothetical protein